MKAIQLYRFLNENGIEMGHDLPTVFAFVPFDLLEDFSEMISYSFFDDGGYDKCVLKKDCLCIDLNELCEYHGIEVEDIKPLLVT